ncbi:MULTISPECIES: NAD(P)H-dependent oxidoreductase [unclassified Bradyrhizobium]|uniref:NAD(P)H-dependent oxidoreductase n=1 Tax=unclassified Bradyrhizobium TaxID=2631580 RepID=UPI0028E49C0F|nr:MULTISPECIES: NAD(P)H-dependent oxidoreductase [unclassified Bradyrhizobium]
MKAFIVLAHPEHQSFNGAMYRAAMEALSAQGHEVRTSDLYAMRFDAASGRHNFLTVKDPAYYKQQTEELYASENHGFACSRRRSYTLRSGSSKVRELNC